MSGKGNPSIGPDSAAEKAGGTPTNPAPPMPPNSGPSTRDFTLHLVVVIVSVLAVIALAVVVDHFRPGQFGSQAIILCGLIFLLSHGAAAGFQFFPRGNEMALFRIGMVAFCRTVLPLVVLLLLEYNGRLEQVPNWGLLALLLFVVPWATGTAWLCAAGQRT